MKDKSKFEEISSNIQETTYSLTSQEYIIFFSKKPWRDYSKINDALRSVLIIVLCESSQVKYSDLNLE